MFFYIKKQIKNPVSCGASETTKTTFLSVPSSQPGKWGCNDGPENPLLKLFETLPYLFSESEPQPKSTKSISANFIAYRLKSLSRCFGCLLGACKNRRQTHSNEVGFSSLLYCGRSFSLKESKKTVTRIFLELYIHSLCHLC